MAEELSYVQILRSAGVAHLELHEARVEPGKSRLITQSAFTSFIGELSGMVNKREENGSFALS